jgi:hypothetical protein
MRKSEVFSKGFFMRKLQEKKEIRLAGFHSINLAEKKIAILFFLGTYVVKKAQKYSTFFM